LAIGTTDPGAALRLIVDRLAQLGFEVFGLDLTRPHLAIPVARVIAPGLQPLPSEIITPRLAERITQTGGGAIYTGDIALI
jgi:ribosomal protein S12 methylthiotransferase accessory factor